MISLRDVTWAIWCKWLSMGVLRISIAVIYLDDLILKIVISLSQYIKPLKAGLIHTTA